MITPISEEMSDESILLAIASNYACPENWESHEKDYGRGNPIDFPAWAQFRDRGDCARRGLAIIEARKAAANA